MQHRWLNVTLLGAIIFLLWGAYENHVRAQAGPSPSSIRLMERQTQALERIAHTLDKIERKL